jgi:tRNA threonylcarbamoyladenosine biosynthesis protein TsaE
VSTSDLHVICRAAAETEALGAQLAGAFSVAHGAPAVLYLTGELGAGKTTFARGFLNQLGVDAPVRSPTYTLLELYPAGLLTVLHLDLYRLESPRELEELGLREWAQPRHIWLIEWPERGAGRLPPPDVGASLTVGPGAHEVTLRARSALGEAWLAGLPVAHAATVEKGAATP